MTPEEVKVESSMSNMAYRSIQEIAEIAEMSWLPVRRIVRSFIDRGLAESQSQGWTTYYRLK